MQFRCSKFPLRTAIFSIFLQQTHSISFFNAEVENFANWHQKVTKHLLDSFSTDCTSSDLDSDWLSPQYSGLKLKGSTLHFLSPPFFFAQFCGGTGYFSAQLHHSSRWRRLGISKSQKRKTNGLALALWTKV